MKVVYEKTIVEKIDDAIMVAKMSNKKIQHIELSQDEFREFDRMVGYFCTVQTHPLGYAADIKYRDVSIVKE